MLFAIISAITLLLFPVFNLILVLNKHRINNFDLYFGVLTDRINTDRLLPSIFNVLFVIRR